MVGVAEEMPLPSALISLPSPPSPVVFEAGPLALSYYGFFIALGVVVATWLTGRELTRKGYDGYVLALEALCFVIPLGLIGARLYYVVANYAQYASNPFPAVLEVWVGGLNIYGAVAGGFLGVVLFGWYRGINALTFADAAAPGVVLGQAIGRLGDYFNQELFGKPSGLPWAIRISPANRPAEFADARSFHPTFLYEAIWNVLVCLVLLWIARRFSERLLAGDVFLLYAILYSVGHFLVEALRVDPVPFLIAGSIRGDLIVSCVLTLGCILILLLRHSFSSRKRPKPG
jgi:phosphatidylglycerol:prolipoprotein diacylglycerol transferase